MYGETGGQLRNALGVLLREHRIQQRLGGQGSFRVPQTTTVDEREELGKQIRRYRQSVLTWSLQAVRSACPQVHLESRSTPAGELHFRLADAIAASGSLLASLDDLGAEQSFATVNSWRHAARAAALGEHDFGGGVEYFRLSHEQSITVLADAADVVRGLVVLDRRYSNVPGWEHLPGQGWLLGAAEACASHAKTSEPDFAVDHLGWHPKLQVIDGPAQPGLGGVLQAEHNLLVNLDEFPNARTLRMVMDSQRVVAHEAVARLGNVGSDLTETWTAREQTYTKLVQETRDIGGLLGSGNPGGSAVVVATRAQKLGREPLTDAKQLGQLDRLFSRIDERIAAAVDHGIRKNVYFQRVPLPRVDDLTPGLVKLPRSRYVPITASVRTDLLDTVRQDLRAARGRPDAPEGAAQSRLDFAAALKHQPERRATRTYLSI